MWIYSKSASNLIALNLIYSNHYTISSHCKVLFPRVQLSDPQVTVFSLRLYVVVQVAVEDRLKLLQEAHRDFGPSSQHFLSSEYSEPITSLKKLESFGGSLFPPSYTVTHPLNFSCSQFTVTHALWMCGCTHILSLPLSHT